MFFGAFSARLLVVAAYLMAALLPVLAASAGRPPPEAQHAQMMVAAGHAMPMEDAGMNDDARMLLCQQHCLVAVATLPAQVPMTEKLVVFSDVIPIADWQVASFAKPPPGPPPKAAVI